MNSVLHETNGIIEVKRVNISTDMEKFINNILSDTNINTGKLNNKTDYANEQHIVHNNNIDLCNKVQCNNDGEDQKLFMHNNTLQTHIAVNTTELIKQYFYKWIIYIKQKKCQMNNELAMQTEQKIKLDNFFKSIKKYQVRKFQGCHTLSQFDSKLEKQIQKPGVENKTSTSLPNGFYKHRFQAQREIIQSQKAKLVQQEKIIRELKLGKLHEEITQSLQETEKEIYQMLNTCSLKVKCKIQMIGITALQTEEPEFRLHSTKAPKIMQILAKRALEREKRRQIILEKKKMLDLRKKEVIEREIQKKKIQDENERKRNLEAIKERRRKDLEAQRQIQIRKQKLLEADNFYKFKLKRFGFKCFITLLAIKRNNMVKSETHYQKYLKLRSVRIWSKFIEKIYESKFYTAETLYSCKLKERMFQQWYKVHTLSIQHLQVAEDLYEMRLQNKTFVHWHRYTCTQYILRQKILEKVRTRYYSRIVFNYFYLWKSLPVVMQLERAKEEKKRKWREKVWEILPDYLHDKENTSFY